MIGLGTHASLQNVVERSVIVSPGDVFCVDEAWLSTDAAKRRLAQPVPAAANGDRVASGRSLKQPSLKAEDEFMVPTEPQPSFEFHRQLLIPRSRN
jgi:hypothetical protein